MLKAVIFDLDGVITDSASYHYEAWKELADKMGIPFDEKVNEQLKGVSRMDSLEIILRNDPQKRNFTQEEKEALCTEKNENYKKLILKITPGDMLPGIAELLKELEEHGIMKGLASVSHNAETILRQLQIFDKFDYIADVNRVKRSKPYPDIFMDCLVSLGVDGRDAIGIEDAAVGIDSIHRAGMRAVGVGSPDMMGAADLILADTSKLSYDKLVELA
ncbi:beta-phosphoglucomutase [Butyrivibrio sp. MC2013]|uniref:beta-phosphoglucomutase n=1 Tax=Butyrivibrio sp. MC2013 TaxID=1280686 RepID=UPI0003FFB70A|nr:beta-phosphoglucomutase [Butyrivibrio sp. MC2013]